MYIWRLLQIRISEILLKKRVRRVFFIEHVTMPLKHLVQLLSFTKKRKSLLWICKTLPNVLKAWLRMCVITRFILPQLPTVKKIPFISPLFHNNKFIAGVKEKNKNLVSVCQKMLFERQCSRFTIYFIFISKVLFIASWCLKQNSKHH